MIGILSKVMQTLSGRASALNLSCPTPKTLHPIISPPLGPMPVSNHTVPRATTGKGSSCVQDLPLPQQKWASVSHGHTHVFYLFLQLCNFLLPLCLKPLQVDSYPAQETPRCQSVWSLGAGVPENRALCLFALPGPLLALEAGCCLHHPRQELVLGSLGPRDER